MAAIEDISAIILRINDHQATIAAAVEEQTATTGEMHRNVAQAADSTVEIANNISGVAQAAQATTEGVEQAQRAADELSMLTADLGALVRQFRF